MDIVDCSRFAVLEGKDVVSFLILDRDFDFLVAFREGVDCDFSLAVFWSGIDLQSLASEVVEVEVVLGNLDQVDVTIDATVEGEVRLLGIDPVVFPVVDEDLEDVFLFQATCEIDAESGISAIVLADFLFVEDDPTGGIDALEFDIEPLSFLHFRAGEAVEVDGFPAIVVPAAVLAVKGVPGVGKGDVFRFLGFGIDEDPIGIDVRYLTHTKVSLPLYSKGGRKCKRLQ